MKTSQILLDVHENSLFKRSEDSSHAHPVQDILMLAVIYNFMDRKYLSQSNKNLCRLLICPGIKLYGVIKVIATLKKKNRIANDIEANLRFP